MSKSIVYIYRAVAAVFNKWIMWLLGGTHHHYTFQIPEKLGFISDILLRLYYHGIRLDDSQLEKIKKLDDSGIVIFVNKHKSLFEFLFAHVRFRLKGLPFPSIGFYYRISFLQPVSRLLRILLAHTHYFIQSFSKQDPFKNGYLREEMLNGNAAFLSLIDKKGFYRRFIKNKTDPMRYALEIQHTTDRPVFIVPQIFFYGQKPLKASSGIIDMLFGAEESPGFIRRLFMRIRNPKRIFVEIGDPVVLKEFLARSGIREMSIERQALTLRQHMLSMINQHRRSIIGPVLKSRAELKENILTGHRLQTFINSHAAKENKPVWQVQKKANDYLEEIAANYSQNWIKVFDLTLRLILRMLFDGMVIDSEGLRRIKKAAKNGPIILLPCHKSHLDYLILSFIFYHNQMPCPHIAAGKNLSFWPLGTIFRGGGAFFLRRSFKGKALYSNVFSEYIYKILQEGFNIEFFIEGTRSRTGKLLLPKLGLLSIILDAYFDGACEDLTFVPIFIGYDRVIEEKSYLHEVEGGQKEPESLKQVIKARKTLKKRYGKVYVNFDAPISFNSFLRQNGFKKQTLYKENRKTLCQDLGFRFINGINHVSVVTPYGIVAAAILNCYKKRVPYEAIEAHLETYMAFLKSTEARLTDTLLSEPDRAFEYVMQVFINRKFIEHAATDKTSFQSKGKVFKINEQRRPGLDYYKSNCVHFFISAAFTALAVLETDTFQFSAPDLHPTYRFLQHLFTNEFAYDVDKTSAFFVRKSIKAFIDDGMLIPHPKIPDTYSLTSAGLRKLKYFALFLKTYFESYLIVLHFYSRYPADKVDAKDHLKKIQTTGSRMYKRREIECSEALSKVTYLNADKFFTAEGANTKEGKTKVETYLAKIHHYLKILQQ